MKIHDIEKFIKDNGLLFPRHLDKQVTIEIMLDNSPEDYPEELLTTKKLLDPALLVMFPNKDKKESINRYLKRIIKENEPIIKVPNPKLDLDFSELYLLDGMQQMRYINEHPDFDKNSWAVFKKDYCQYD